MHIVNIILFWLFFGFWASYVARKKGRNPKTWFFLGTLLGVIGVALAYFLPKPRPKPVSPLVLPPQEPIFEKKWYYLTPTHEQKGPFADLLPNWKNKEITENSFIWTEGMENWKKLYELPELFKDFSSCKD